MKRVRKKIVLLLVVVIVLAFASLTASAGSTSYTLSGDYQTVFSTGGGLNRNITLECRNINIFHHNDVRMLDEHGDVIWESYGAVGYNGIRTFWCGSDVYVMQARVGAMNILGMVTPYRADCTVSW